MARHMSESQSNEGWDSWEGASRDDPFAAGESYHDYSYEAGNYYDEGYSRHHRRRRRWPVVLVCIILVLLVAGGACGVMLYQSAMRVREQVTIATNGISAIKDDLASGDEAMLSQRVSDVAAAALVMHQETDSLVWKVGQFAPVVGRDVHNVATLASVLDDISQNALVPLAGNVSKVSLDNLMGDGGFNMVAIQQLVGVLGEVAPALTRANNEISDLEPGRIGQVNNALEKARAQIEPLGALASEADRIAQQLPLMLGANGQTRHYLILAQSNAELRSVGGFPGSWGTLDVTDGQLELGDFYSPQYIYQEVPVAEDEQFFYGNDVVGMVTSVGINPNFPRVAQVICDIYKKEQAFVEKEYIPFDGVFAVDPIFLQQVLALTGGSVNMYGVFVDGTNAAEMILSRIYWDVAPEYQDAIFSATAEQAFDSLVHNMGGVDIKELFELAQEGGENRHLMMWFADSEQERLMELAHLTGAVHTDVAEPYVGVYLNDYTYSKMDWYLSCDTSWGVPVHNEDGTDTYHVSTLLANHITESEVWRAPQYVVSNGKSQWINNLGDIGTYVLLYAPAGGTIANIEVDNPARIKQDVRMGTVNGLTVASLIPAIPRESALTISYDIIVPADATEPLKLDTTPTPQAIAGW